MCFGTEYASFSVIDSTLTLPWGDVVGGRHGDMMRLVLLPPLCGETLVVMLAGRLKHRGLDSSLDRSRRSK